MIDLPDYSKKYEHENDFYLSCDGSRLAKTIAQYLLLQKVAKVTGDIVECGVFKGASFARFAMYRRLLGLDAKQMVGFDSFGSFPETGYEKDQALREKFISEAGDQSISINQLLDVLSNKACNLNVSLVAGDITRTVPEFVADHPDTKISLLNLDVDIYEPSVTVLEYLYPRISVGGIMILDDYGTFPGETNAVDEFFSGSDVNIEEPVLPGGPRYIVKK